MRILIRGAGDLATGIAYRLYKCGFEIIMTETKVPLTVRRTIAFSRAVYEGNAEVEHVTAKLTDGPEQIDARIKKGYFLPYASYFFNSPTPSGYGPVCTPTVAPI